MFNRLLCRLALAAVALGLFGSAGFVCGQTTRIEARKYSGSRPVAGGGSSAGKDYLDRRPLPGEAGGTVENLNSQKAATAHKYITVKRRARKPPHPVPPIPPRESETARLGFTIWRLKDLPDAEKSKGLTETDERTGTARRAERLDSNSPLAIGDKVRIGIESLTHKGYLYIIDREKYADGSYGPPMLIYPTLRYNNGNNLVSPGDVVFLPGPGREITVTMNTGRKQAAEELMIIVSPTRLIPQSDLQMEQIKISADQTLKWIADWSAEEVQIDQVGTTGQAMSQQELTSGTEQSKGLTEHPLSQADPLPQTIFEMKIRKGKPMITTVTLPIRQN